MTMKHTILFLWVLIGLGLLTQAQSQTLRPASEKYLQLGLRGGVDFGHLFNMPATVKMPLQGLNAGFSADKYWGWWGIGVDLDIYRNKGPRYDSSGMIMPDKDWPLKDYQDSSSDLTRYFAGIGPSFKFQSKNAKLSGELNLRGGISFIDGGRVKADALFSGTTGSMPLEMMHHAGYQEVLKPAAKIQARIGYAIAPKWALQLGAYYIYHIDSDNPYNYAEIIALPTNVNYVTDLTSVSSYGAFAGISYKIFGNRKAVKPNQAPLPVPMPEKQVAEIEIINKDVLVFVKDEQTDQPLYNVEVKLKMSDNTFKIGYTDKVGMIRFEQVPAENYQLTGLLNDINSTEAAITKESFTTNPGYLSYHLTHNDPRFTLVGKAINLNTGLEEGAVQVTLTNETHSSVRQASTAAANGAFRFQLEGGSDFKVSGKKNSYLSNIEQITTKGLNRSQVLYVQLELGMEHAATGKKITLRNIYYDLNKADIRDDASSDLRKLLLFLYDNPDLKVELASHTDARGSDAYNLQLSQKRAQAVVDYLVENGIARNRMIAKGYGETQLVNHCANGINCSEAEHQMNRRTEIKVIEGL